MHHSTRRQKVFKSTHTDADLLSILSCTTLLTLTNCEYRESWKIFDGTKISSLLFGEGYVDINTERLERAQVGALLDIKYTYSFNDDIEGVCPVTWSKTYRKSSDGTWVLEE